MIPFVGRMNRLVTFLVILALIGLVAGIIFLLAGGMGSSVTPADFPAQD